MKRYKFWIVLRVMVLIGGVVFDTIAAVKPSMPPLREGDPEPARPTASDKPISPIFKGTVPI